VRARIHRGSHEIGGSCVEVEASDGSRALLDLGRPLSAGWLVSHAHLGHYRPGRRRRRACAGGPGHPRRRLEENVAILRQALQEFAKARNAQVAAWPDPVEATIREAVQELQKNAIQATETARVLGARGISSTGRLLGRLGQRLQSAAALAMEEPRSAPAHDRGEDRA
jgi:hypothetical protein